MLVDSTSIPLRNLQSSPPASCHVYPLASSKNHGQLLGIKYIGFLIDQTRERVFHSISKHREIG